MKKAQKIQKARSTILFSLSIGIVIIFGCSNDSISKTTETDSDGDTDSDTLWDTGGDTVTNTDNNIDTDTEIDSEIDTGTGSEFDPMDPEKYGYQLVFEDEFDGTELDSSKWAPFPELFQHGDFWWEADNHQLTGTGQVRLDVTEVDGTVYCGAIRTVDLNSVPLFEQKYGYFETRCTTPQIHGGWATFGLMPSSNASDDEENYDAEIVVFETEGGWENRISHALIWEDHGAGWNFFDRDDLYDGGFHTFGLLWTPEKYVFYIDGIETWRDGDWGVNHVEMPKYMKLTLEVDDGISAGYWEDQKEIPYYFYVDYVKAYQLN